MTRWLWPALLGVSLAASLALSSSEAADGSAILAAGTAVTVFAVLSLAAAVTTSITLTSRLGRGVAADLAVARLRFAGSSTYRGAQGIVCTLVVLCLGVGIIRVLDAATTVGDVAWRPDQVRDDVAFVSASAAAAERVAAGAGAGADGRHYLRTDATIADSYDQRILIGRCNSGSAITVDIPTSCPALVAQSDTAVDGLADATIRIGSTQLTATVDRARIGAPPQFTGEPDAVLLLVDDATFDGLAATIRPSVLRDVAAVEIPADDPAAVERLREAVWADDGLAFSGGRSSLSSVVTKADLVSDGRHYEDLYGTIVKVFSTILITVFAVTAFFGTAADVGDGRDQRERLDLLGAGVPTQRRASWIRSAVPLLSALCLGGLAGVVLGISYSRLSGYTDVLPGALAGYPIGPALGMIAVAGCVLIAAAATAIRTSATVDPLARLRDR